MHIYTCTDGREVPSVTTILQILGSKEIIRWANYLGFKHINYDQEMDRTAVKGTKMHECMQHVVDPALSIDSVEFVDPFEKDYFMKMVARFNKMMVDFPYKTIFTEREFSSSLLGYGGKVDWYTEINGLKMICDFKSSKQVRIKQLFQLGGYYNLLVEAGESPDGGAIILVNQNTCALYPIGKEDIIQMGKIFNKFAEIYPYVQELMPYNASTLEKLKENKK